MQDSTFFNHYEALLQLTQGNLDLTTRCLELRYLYAYLIGTRNTHRRNYESCSRTKED
jgi:hypothetical protein